MEKILEIKTIDPTVLMGVRDKNLNLIEKFFPVSIIARGEVIKIKGEKKIIEQVHNILFEMVETVGSKGDLTAVDVQNLIDIGKSKIPSEDINHSFEKNVIYFGMKGSIVPKTKNQIKYLDLVKEKDIVFSIGPAGTGKTFLSVVFAVAALDNKEIKRIVLCRPAVEAGESLGFLPGDLQEKVDPYLAPLYDSLDSIIPKDKIKRYIDEKIIEIIPLAYMRGRTLDNAFMILDEAQNTTVAQMKMFLTRLGIGSKAIITGDITQVDLHDKSVSGLMHAADILKKVNDIGFVSLNEEDVVRHRLVKKIILAYDNIISSG
tara:strand:- start:187 stop:1140 length:954 start_codon:yes stop_codon:yes gene_type:complete